MDDATQRRIQDLKMEIFDASEEISNALESGEDRRQLDAGAKVEDIVRRFQALLAEGGAVKLEAERTLERRLTDLRRQAASLTRRSPGQAAKRAVDAGFVPFIEQRTPSKSIVPQRHAPTRDKPTYSVGGEIDAWCGKCGEMRTHHIVAMVGDEPKQVICQSCRSRHGYRTGPARASHDKTKGEGTPSSTQAVASTKKSSSANPQEREAERRREQQKALLAELAAATDPRVFNPKERYKAGEIIQHPEHGRGKIENVLKGSMLVRFREGLRPVNLA